MNEYLISGLLSVVFLCGIGCEVEHTTNNNIPAKPAVQVDSPTSVTEPEATNTYDRQKLEENGIDVSTYEMLKLISQDITQVSFEDQTMKGPNHE